MVSSSQEKIRLQESDNSLHKSRLQDEVSSHGDFETSQIYIFQYIVENLKNKGSIWPNLQKWMCLHILKLKESVELQII